MEITLETWLHEEVYSVIQFLWAKHVFPLEIHHRLIEVYDIGVLWVHHIRKWCREFEKDQTNIHNDNWTGALCCSWKH
jgi:hypothetical protein